MDAVDSFVDMFQIMGVGVSNDPALGEIWVVRFELGQTVHIFYLNAGKAAVRRMKPRLERRLVEFLSIWAGS